jgi:peptidoglycan lytic transglycosylase
LSLAPDKMKVMRHRFTFAFAVLAGLILSFSSASAFGPKRYHDGETQRGLASWYGAEHQGEPTADGETFDMHQFTAAHRHLPFGTIVRVTNQLNGISVDVRINDRGPFGDGDRIIDVSSAAADVLQMKGAGIVPVEIEIIRLGSPARANPE